MKKFTFDSHNPPQEVLDMVGREVWDSWISMKFFPFRRSLEMVGL